MLSTKHRHTYEENLIEVMQFCRQPRSLHAIKDKFYFNCYKLKRVMDELQGQGYVIVCLVPRDGRGTQAIQLTVVGKEYLFQKGIKY